MKKKRQRHGLEWHPLYDKWGKMKARCYNKNNPKYHRYGGRGVVVCSEWLNDFKAFYDWCMANGWENGLQVDKDIKAKKLGKEGLIYSPEWCSIVSNAENSNYRKATVFVEINGEIKNIMQWCSHYGINQSTFYHRIRVLKMTIADALTTPPTRIYAKRRTTPTRSKLTWGKAKQIREIKKLGVSNSMIAKQFKVNASTISSIVNNKSWIK